MSGEEEALPAVLILGGCGFLGRNLVLHLVSGRLASLVKVCDKARPEMSFFNERYLEAFEDQIVTFQQNDLTRDAHVERAFMMPDGVNKACFDVVINLAAETRQGQPAELYASRCTLLAKLCSLKAVEKGVRRFVQVSTAQVYKCSRSLKPHAQPASETSPVEPCTPEARSTYAAEQEVLGLQDELEVVILRLAHVYGGGGDTQLVMTQAVCAAVYTELGGDMTMLWGGHLKTNTVHVTDVCRALSLCLAPSPVPRSSLWNLSDSGDTDQTSLSRVISSVFRINTSFYGRVMSTLAGLRLNEAAASANERHMQPWSDLCARDGILNTPLSPFLHGESLECRHLHVSGASFSSSMGFSYQHPEVTEELLRESVALAVQCGTFPGSCVKID